MGDMVLEIDRNVVSRDCMNEGRSTTDIKQYRHITLQNGLRVVLIQDVRPSSITEKNPSKKMCYEEEYSTDCSDSDNLCASHYEQWEEDCNKSTVCDSAKAFGHYDMKLAAACMTVSVGSMSDPCDLPGLAHYLEHMLFMGSAKYPNEEDFEIHLSANGGSSNGATECESTRFLFDIHPKGLDKALDMFAQFFITPLFREETMDRELQAIESEFNRAKQNDAVRLQQIQCETCLSGHAYNSFGWGNVKSLKVDPELKGIEVRKRIIDFYKDNYSSDRMNLCIYGGYDTSLDTLEAWTIHSFSGIQKRVTIPASMNFGPSKLPLQPFGVMSGVPSSIIRVVPVEDAHNLHLYWMLPPLLVYFKTKPWRYLASILGHEGEGSFTKFLRDKQWVSSVSVGVSEDDSYEFGSFGAMFEVHLTLTDLGLELWEDCLTCVFKAIRFTKQIGFQKWLFEELETASALNFTFQEEIEPIDLCQRISHIMQERYMIANVHDLLRYDVIEKLENIKDDNCEAISNIINTLLGYMNPENSRMVISSPLFESTMNNTNIMHSSKNKRMEKWCGTTYTMEKTPANLLDRLNYDLTVVPINNSVSTINEFQPQTPQPNQFLPDNLVDLEAASTPPDYDDMHTREPLQRQRSKSNCERLKAAYVDVIPEILLSDISKLNQRELPVRIRTTTVSQLWYKYDQSFNQPKTNANIRLSLSSATRNIEGLVFSQLYIRLVNRALLGLKDHAASALQDFSIYFTDYAIEVCISGLTATLATLVHLVLKKLFHLNPREHELSGSVVEAVRDEMIRDLKNSLLAPSLKARYLRLQLLDKFIFPIEDQIDVLQPENFSNMLQNFYTYVSTTLWNEVNFMQGDHVTIIALIHGTYSNEEAIKLMEDVEEMYTSLTETGLNCNHIFPLQLNLASPGSLKNQTTICHTTIVPATTNGVLLRDLSEHEHETNSMVEVYYQLGDGNDPSDIAFADLLEALMSQPLFNYIRTREAMAYDVYCAGRDTNGVLGFSLCVLSASHGTGEIAQKLDDFLHIEFYQKLKDLRPQDLEYRIKTLKQLKQKPFTTLSDETAKFWAEICRRRCNFNLEDIVIWQLGKITVEELLHKYEDLFLGDDDNETRKLRVHVIGRNSKKKNVRVEDVLPRSEIPVIVNNIPQFKNSLTCHHCRLQQERQRRIKSQIIKHEAHAKNHLCKVKDTKQKPVRRIARSSSCDEAIERRILW